MVQKTDNTGLIASRKNLTTSGIILVCSGKDLAPLGYTLASLE